MQLHIQHCTTYEYPGLASDSHNELRLTPATDATQVRRWSRISVDPHATLFSYTEPGGVVVHFNIRQPHNCLRVCQDALVETLLPEGVTAPLGERGDMEFYFSPETRNTYADFLYPTELVPITDVTQELESSARSQSDGSAVGFLTCLNTAICERLLYVTGVTDVGTPAPMVLEQGSGVCQDYTHVMLAACRRSGIPSRYVSGYVYSPEDHPNLHASQATHAWVECLLPDRTWLGLDPTNNALVDGKYVKMHWGRDYREATPIKGIFLSAKPSKLTVGVTVTRMTQDN